eukprot:scaffold1829_cov194-Ochromonas_danica.AAC.29
MDVASYVDALMSALRNIQRDDNSSFNFSQLDQARECVDLMNSGLACNGQDNEPLSEEETSKTYFFPEEFTNNEQPCTTPTVSKKCLNRKRRSASVSVSVSVSASTSAVPKKARRTYKPRATKQDSNGQLMKRRLIWRYLSVLEQAMAVSLKEMLCEEMRLRLQEKRLAMLQTDEEKEEKDNA